MDFSLLAAGVDGVGVNPWVALAYLVAGVFFILALRGLSSPATSRAGNRNGMIGMLIAVVTTLVTHDIANIVEIGIAIFITPPITSRMVSAIRLSSVDMNGTASSANARLW